MAIGKKKSTLEQVREAYENLDDNDKKTFHQSIADRVHESIAAQEVDEHDRDSQSAEDREHEALGAEHADERRERKRDVEERDERRDERREEHHDGMADRLDRLIDVLERRFGEKSEDRLDRAREKYGVSPRSVPLEKKEISTEEALRLLDRAR